MKIIEAFALPRGTPEPLGAGLLLSVDPGATTGWALWSPRTQGPRGARPPELLACGTGGPRYRGVVSLVIEVPQIYPGGHQRPQDLITLALMAGRLVGAAEASGVTAAFVFPHEWKGNLPTGKKGGPDVVKARTLARLSGEELRVIHECGGIVPAGQFHNVLDAVGIGLHAYRKATA